VIGGTARKGPGGEFPPGAPVVGGEGFGRLQIGVFVACWIKKCRPLDQT